MACPRTARLILCEPVRSKCTWTCHKSHFVQKFPRKMQCSYRDTRFVRACAVSQASFCVEIFRQNARRDCRDNRFVRACAVEMHMDIAQEPFYMDIYRKNDGRGHLRGHRFGRACAVEMHVDKSPFCVEIYGEHAKLYRYHLD